MQLSEPDGAFDDFAGRQFQISWYKKIAQQYIGSGRSLK